MDQVQLGLAAYDDPFLWWGPVWETPRVRSVAELIRDGVLSPLPAGLIWGMLARRASVVVAAGPRGVGKTTVLTALLDFYPSTTRRIYLRGCYESFAFLDDVTIIPEESVLLINEISPHLPAYLWGPGVRRTLQARRRGFTLAATAHASAVEELVGQLAGYPLCVPMPDVAALGLVVLLGPRSAQGDQWGVTEVWSMRHEGRQGLKVEQLADQHDISHCLANSMQLTHPIPPHSEVRDRAAFLMTVAAGEAPVNVAQVRAALASFPG